VRHPLTVTVLKVFRITRGGALVGDNWGLPYTDARGRKLTLSNAVGFVSAPIKGRVAVFADCYHACTLRFVGLKSMAELRRSRIERNRVVYQVVLTGAVRGMAPNTYRRGLKGSEFAGRQFKIVARLLGGK